MIICNPLSAHWLPKLLYFHGPIILILIANIFFFSHSAIYIHRNFAFAKTEEGEPLDESVREKERYESFKFHHIFQYFNMYFSRFSVYLKLFLTMGLLWTMESISWIFEKESEKNYFFIFTDILNCLQGVFIFIIFVCKRKVLNMTKERMYRIMDKVRF